MNLELKKQMKQFEVFTIFFPYWKGTKIEKNMFFHTKFGDHNVFILNFSESIDLKKKVKFDRVSK